MKNYLIKLGKKSKKAGDEILDSKKKNKVLNDYCNLLLNNQSKIIYENKKDLRISESKKLKENLIKRLIIDKRKILEIIK